MLEHAPVWVFGVVLAVGLVIAEEIGARIQVTAARRRPEGRSDKKATSESVGFLLSATLALLGLLIAFTFSAASERYDTRRLLVVDEANAIGTAYLRMQTLDEPFRTTLSRLMLPYLDARQAFVAAGEDPAKLDALEARTDVLQDRIWAEVVKAVQAQPEATINPALLQAVNDMFDLASSRRAALDAHVPGLVLGALVVYALLSAGALGYGLPQARRSFVVSVSLFLLVTLAIMLIVDLDRPRGGIVRPSQTPMDRAIAEIRHAEAAKASGAAER